MKSNTFIFCVCGFVFIGWLCWLFTSVAPLWLLLLIGAVAGDLDSRE